MTKKTKLAPLPASALATVRGGSDNEVIYLPVRAAVGIKVYIDVVYNHTAE
jgi:hypothetical protein